MKHSRVARIAALLLVLLVLCALIAPSVSLGRAGGGHTSNSGHSSSGSSHSSSSGSSHSSSSGYHSSGSGLGLAGVPLVASGGSLTSCCMVFIVILVIVIVLFVIRSMNKNGGGSGPSRGDSGPIAPPPGPVSFDAIKADAPNFSEQAFYGRVNEMFLAIQKAWEARNMEPARRFLSQEQFDVLQGGVGEYVRNGQINKLDSIHIDQVSPVSVTREGGSDYVKVVITASVIDYTIDERTHELVNPKLLGDGKTLKTFDEYWTLVRKVGAQTKADATIKKCPNCGGPVTDGNYVKCAYCGTMMNDPALDWVLLRIEQP